MRVSREMEGVERAGFGTRNLEFRRGWIVVHRIQLVRPLSVWGGSVRSLSSPRAVRSADAERERRAGSLATSGA
jgi:hypothetical protein